MLAFPGNASAHLAIKGAGDFGNGALHPLVTPQHLMIVLGLALLLGMRVPLRLKLPTAALAISAAVALGLMAFVSFSPPELLLTLLAMSLGLLVAIGPTLPPAVLAGICAICAAAVGLDSGVDPESGMVAWKTLLGTWLGLTGVTGYLALAISNGAEKNWARTGMRILGSWIFAIAILMLAFALKSRSNLPNEKSPQSSARPGQLHSPPQS